MLRSVVWNDLGPLVGGTTGDKCDRRLDIAHVEHFMRHTGLDVDEIAGLVFDHLFQAWSEFVTHFAFDDVENYFKADMNVRISDASRRDGGDIRGQACRSHVLA